MALEFGTPKMQGIIEYQIEKLKKLGYEITSSYNFDTRVYVQVRKGKFIFGKALIHDGEREDMQRAVHEACYHVLNEAWTHYQISFDKQVSELDYLIRFGLDYEKDQAQKDKKKLLESYHGKF